MLKMTGLSTAETEKISKEIADAFYDYRYNKGERGLLKYISSREAMFTYIHAIIEASYNSGLLYTTSAGREGYMVLAGEGAGSIKFLDGIKMILAEKRALGGFGNMKKFIGECFADGGSIETRMIKTKRNFLRIEVLVVRKEFQGKGFMKQMLDYAYDLADKNNLPLILDTDDKDKSARYEHLGMTLDRVRNCSDMFHMYDLIREPVTV